MQEFWTNYAQIYGGANDLEEKQRLFVANFLSGKTGNLLEFASGNGKVISHIREAGFKGDILGVDYNKEMVEVARTRLPNEKFIQGDILEAEKFLGEMKFDFVICLNSLHNLPDKKMIFNFLEAMKKYTKQGGYIIFDVRNSLNPGVNYGYYRNRKRGLQFFTLFPDRIKQIFKTNFEPITDTGVNYSSPHVGDSFVKNSLYKFYFHLTSWKWFSPYRLFIFRKK
ncbi:MAG: hypothetical protein HHAS10_02270 [Candidatus Altimarinota bacterium]